MRTAEHQPYMPEAPAQPIIIDAYAVVEQCDSKEQALGMLDGLGNQQFADLKEQYAAISNREEYAAFCEQRHQFRQLQGLAKTIEASDTLAAGRAAYAFNQLTVLEHQPAAPKTVIKPRPEVAAENKTPWTLVADKLRGTAEVIKNKLSPATIRKIGGVALSATLFAANFGISSSAEPIAAHPQAVTAEALPPAPAVIETPAVEAIVEPAAELLTTKEVIVQPGDTLTILSQSHETTVEAIVAANPAEITDPDLIYAGATLDVPLSSEAVETPAPAVETEAPIESVAGANLEATQDINGVDKELIKEVVVYLIEEQGASLQGAAYLTGNFIQESGLDPKAPGGGLAQLQGARAQGMPEGLREQLEFLMNVEIDRDGGAAHLNELVRNSDGSVEDIQTGLKAWERWGTVGKRFEHGAAILAAITTPIEAPAETAVEAPVELSDLQQGNLELLANAALNANLVTVFTELNNMYDFRISSTNGGKHSPNSQHYQGNAIDIGGRAGINGEPFTYEGYSPLLEQFIKDTIDAMPEGTCLELGVPNARYVEAIRAYAPQCKVFPDKGSGAHFHASVAPNQ